MNISYLCIRSALLASAAAGLLAITAPQAAAQANFGTREFQAAELEGLAPALRAEVLARAANPGNSIRGVLETILLNAIQARYPASRIVALDMGRGVAAIATAENQLRAVTFDKQGLTSIGDVTITR
jgi:hypothetical protein